MGLAERDYMRKRGAEKPKFTAKLPSTSGPNWTLAIVTVIVIALASFAIKWFAKPKETRAFPETGAVSWYAPTGDAASRAPLTVTAPAGSSLNYAVLLRERSTKKLIAVVPVRANETASVEVPLGEYDIEVSSGKWWKGPESLFADGTLQRAERPMHFYVQGNQRMGHHIDLTQRFDGNLKMRPVGLLDR